MSERLDFLVVAEFERARHRPTPVCPRIRPRHRRALKRVWIGFVAILINFSIFLQQTQAYPLLWQHPFERTHTFRPGIFETLVAYAGVGWRSIARTMNLSLGSFQEDDQPTWAGGPGDLNPDPTHGGAVYQWEAGDTFLAVAGVTATANLANGNLFSSVHVCDFGGQSFVSFDLYYNSLVSVGLSTLPGGWRHSYSDVLDLSQVPSNRITLTTSDGRQIVFDKIASVWTPPTGIRLSLTEVTGEYHLTDRKQNKWVFSNSTGLLNKVINSASNPIDLTYTSGKLTTITQPVSGDDNVITLTYTGSLLTKVTAPSIQNPGSPMPPPVLREFVTEFDGSNRFKGIATGRQDGLGVHPYYVRFGYDAAGKVSSISDYNDLDPTTNTTVDVEYLSSRVSKAIYPVECDYAYDPAQHSGIPYSTHGACTGGASGTLLRTYKQYTYTNHPSGYVQYATVRDERAEETDYTFDTSSRLTSVIDPLNREIAAVLWNSNFDMTSMEDVRGTVTTYGYSGAPGNVTSITQTVDGLTRQTLMSYDTLNNVTQVTDALGNVTAYDYDNTFTTQLSGVDYGNNTSFELNFVYGTTVGVDSGQLKDAIDCNEIETSTEYVRGYPTCEEYGHRGELPLALTPDSIAPPENLLQCDSDATCKQNDATGHPNSQATGTCASCRSFHTYNAEDDPIALKCDCDTDDNFQAGEGDEGLACTPSGDQITYDGNQNILTIRNDQDENWILYTYTYDVRNRALTRTASYVEGCKPLIRWGASTNTELQAGYDLQAQYSPITGRYRTTYTRINPDGPDRASIITETFRDASGRTSQIKRGETVVGLATVATYTYADAVHPLVAVTETKPVGANTLYSKVYVNEAEEVELILHDWNATNKAEFKYTRDKNGRVTKLESRFNGATNYITTNYAYGAGNLSSSDIDPTTSVNKTKLYWNWLSRVDVDQNAMFEAGHPYNLTSEERIECIGTDKTINKREYFYDCTGNRLAQRERKWSGNCVGPAPDILEWTRVTRYNYSYNANKSTGNYQSGEPSYTYTVPYRNEYLDNASNDYGANTTEGEAYGRNELKHTTTYCTDAIGHDDCSNVANQYADTFVDYSKYYGDGSLQRKEEWRAGQGAADTVTTFDYKSGLLDSAAIVTSALSKYEFHAYDAFGARVAKHNYDGEARYPAVMHDRDLQGRVIAERRREGVAGSFDQFMSTYTYGALGLISRTAEKENVSTADNVEYWYLGDAMGNHAGVLDNTGSAQFREYDAFGVHRGTLILAGSGYYRVLPGPYMWRGGEGSETDVYTDQDLPPESPINSLSTGLVHMGYRYYEPQTGRFTQRDPIPPLFGSPLTLNPYIYVENDPANASDASGLFYQLIGLALMVTAAVWGAYASSPGEAALAGALGILGGIIFAGPAGLLALGTALLQLYRLMIVALYLIFGIPLCVLFSLFSNMFSRSPSATQITNFISNAANLFINWFGDAGSRRDDPIQGVVSRALQYVEVNRPKRNQIKRCSYMYCQLWTRTT